MKLKLTFLILIILTLTGCADSISPTEILEREPVGFFYGLWHGWIAVFAFIISLFSDSTAVYAVYNSGGWYDLGFLIGIGSFSCGCAVSQ